MCTCLVCVCVPCVCVRALCLMYVHAYHAYALRVYMPRELGLGFFPVFAGGRVAACVCGQVAACRLCMCALCAPMCVGMHMHMRVCTRL